MAQVTHVFVTVPKGKLVPVHPSEASGAGGALLKCEPGKVYRLPWSSSTRRRIKAGDFVLSNLGGTAVDTPEKAIANDAITGPDGAIASDQRTDDVINAEAAKLAAAPSDTGKA